MLYWQVCDIRTIFIHERVPVTLILPATHWPTYTLCTLATACVQYITSTFIFFKFSEASLVPDVVMLEGLV